MRRWLALTLAGAMLTAGCMGGGGGGGGQAQQQPEPSAEQVERSVKKALHDDEMKDYLRTQVRTEAGLEMLEMALDTEEGQKAVHEAVKRVLNSSVGQQAISKQFSDMIEDDPTVKLQLQQTIRQTIMEVLSKGAEQQKGQKSGGKGGGGGSEGGGGGGSGGGS